MTGAGFKGSGVHVILQEPAKHCRIETFGTSFLRFQKSG